MELDKGAYYCDVCTVRFDPDSGKVSAEGGNSSVGDWKTSAVNGCYFCQVIFDGCHQYFAQNSPNDYVIENLIFWVRGDLTVTYARVDWRRGSDDPKNAEQLFLDFYTVNSPIERAAHSASSVSQARPNRRFWTAFRCASHVSASGDKAIDYCYSMLKDCDRYHATCSTGAGALPSRVLELKSTVARSKDLKLTETKDIPLGSQGNYVALSHCWGRHQPLRLLTANLKELKKGFSHKELPILFQDAIETTRRLGVQYIWIDALCIVQDSPLDWEIESARMRSVYHNAYVTLAATSSAHSGQSFLNVDRPQARLGVPIRISQSPGPNEWRPTVFVRAQSLHFKAPLDHRAWTLQEKINSLRVIEFTDDVIFHCSRGSFRDCNAHVLDSRNRGDAHQQEDDTDIRSSWQTLSSQRSPLQKPKYYKTWITAVETYSDRNLTFDEDRLPAFSGIASDFSLCTGVEGYAAGLWKEEFVLCLGWKPFIMANFSAERHYIAPSWSWASLQGRVRYMWSLAAHIDYLAQVISVSCQVPGANMFGKVTSGYAILKGPLLETQLFPFLETYPDTVTRIPRANSYEFGNLPRSGWAGWYPDTHLQIFEHRQVDGTLVWTATRDRLALDKKSDEKGTQGIFTVWVLCLGLVNKGQGSRSIVFLILGRSQEEPNYFERLGLHELEYSDADDTVKLWFEKAADTEVKIV